jgi:hypothetical protein
MAPHKLLSWRGSGGLGVSEGDDVTLVDWLFLGSGSTLLVNDSAIDIGAAGTSAILINKGSTGITDELATINNGTSGALIFIRCLADITAKHGTGNIKLAGGVDFYMDFGATQCTLSLFFDGTNWLEIARGTDLS